MPAQLGAEAWAVARRGLRVWIKAKWPHRRLGYPCEVYVGFPESLRCVEEGSERSAVSGSHASHAEVGATVALFHV